jgi:GNAT superfamily N-acetyltransferase
MTIRVETLEGRKFQEALPRVAELRIQVFRDWPYLYDGTHGYESHYLERFADAQGAIIVAAYDGKDIIGVATGTPMTEHADEFAEPFRTAGYKVGKLFYFGESVLLSDYRGRGIGHQFFDHREAHARALGLFTHTTFSSVMRPASHPLRPQNTRDLHPFWLKRGYKKLDGIIANFDWKDIDQPEKTAKPMQFWIRPLIS